MDTRLIFEAASAAVAECHRSKKALLRAPGGERDGAEQYEGGKALILMLCDVGSSGPAGVAAITAGKGAEPPQNERSLKHQLEASIVRVL